MADIVRRRPQGLAGVPRGRGRELSPRRDGPITEFLAFRLGEDPYAAPVSIIREILKLPSITRVPRAPHHVLGITSVRGQLITVIDLRRRLRLQAAEVNRRNRVLLVDTGAETLGLLVDEVLQVYRLADSEIEMAASSLGGDVAEYITGIARPSTSAGPWPQEEEDLDGIAEEIEEEEAPEVVILLDLRSLLVSPTPSTKTES